MLLVLYVAAALVVSQCNDVVLDEAGCSTSIIVGAVVSVPEGVVVFMVAVVMVLYVHWHSSLVWRSIGQGPGWLFTMCVSSSLYGGPCFEEMQLWFVK